PNDRDPVHDPRRPVFDSKSVEERAQGGLSTSRVGAQSVEDEPALSQLAGDRSRVADVGLRGQDHDEAGALPSRGIDEDSRGDLLLPPTGDGSRGTDRYGRRNRQRQNGNQHGGGRSSNVHSMPLRTRAFASR